MDNLWASWDSAFRPKLPVQESNNRSAIQVGTRGLTPYQSAMATGLVILILQYIVPACIVYVFFALVQLDLWARLIWRHRYGLSQVPGPRFAAWSRLWIVRALASSSSHEIWAEVNEAYGESLILPYVWGLMSNKLTLHRRRLCCPYRPKSCHYR